MRGHRSSTPATCSTPKRSAASVSTTGDWAARGVALAVTVHRNPQITVTVNGLAVLAEQVLVGRSHQVLPPTFASWAVVAPNQRGRDPR